MNEPANSELVVARPASLPRACALLALALAVPLPAFVAFGFFRSGIPGVGAALLACGICLASGTLALTITAVAQNLKQGIQGILGAMLVRMGVPLGAIVVLPEIGGALVPAGVVGMLMAYYLITLVVETWLSLRFVPALKNSGEKSPAAKVA